MPFPPPHIGPPQRGNAHEYDRNTEETSAVDRLFSGRVLCRGKHEQTVLAARTAEGRTSRAAIKGNKGFLDGGRANNLKSCVSHRAGGLRSSDIATTSIMYSILDRFFSIDASLFLLYSNLIILSWSHNYHENLIFD